MPDVSIIFCFVEKRTANDYVVFIHQRNEMNKCEIQTGEQNLIPNDRLSINNVFTWFVEYSVLHNLKQVVVTKLFDYLNILVILNFSTSLYFSQFR